MLQTPPLGEPAQEGEARHIWISGRLNEHLEVGVEVAVSGAHGVHLPSGQSLYSQHDSIGCARHQPGGWLAVILSGGSWSVVWPFVWSSVKRRNHQVDDSPLAAA